MADSLPGWELVERPSVRPADEVATRQLLGHLVVAAQRSPDGFLREVVRLTLLLGANVGQLGVDGRGHIGGEGPGGRGPDEKGGVLPVHQGQAHVDGEVGPFLVPLGDDLVLGEARTAPGAPRHHVVSLVDPPLLVAGLQEVPNRVVVLV